MTHQIRQYLTSIDALSAQQQSHSHRSYQPADKPSIPPLLKQQARTESHGVHIRM